MQAITHPTLIKNKKSGRQDYPSTLGSAKMASLKKSAVAAGSRTEVLILSQKIGATGLSQHAGLCENGFA
jgi:hypothetical protein